jgi:tetratricopeptide (TPR) repeat protein
VTIKPGRKEGVAMTDPVRPVGHVAQPRVRHAVWGREIPFRNPNFTGRETELAALRAYLLADSTALIGQPVQAVHGLGGVGKTELAAEYAHRYRADYDLVWWIRAEREDAITAALVALGTRLGLEDYRSNERDYSVGVVMDALIAGEPFENWLLIFDDAHNASVISRYVPQSRGHGHVIITSRDIRWQALRVDGIELTEFKLAETIEFLRKRVPALAPVVDSVNDGQPKTANHFAKEEYRSESAEKLATVLGNLPLAADHAAAYLKETGASVEEYLKLYEDNAHALLGRDLNIAYPRPVATTWSVSMRAVSSDASAVFHLVAFFAPEPIAEELLIQRAMPPLPQAIADVLSDVSRFRPAVRELARYSLVRIDGVRNIVQMHRVVRAVTRDRLEREDAGKASELQKTVHLLLAASDPCAPDREDSGPIYERSREHLVESGAVESNDPAVRQLIINQVRRLHRSGGYTESLALGVPALERWHVDFGPDDKLTLRLAIEVAVAMRSIGRWEEAAKLNEDTLGRLERLYGEMDEIYLECARSYGRDLSMLGRYNEALENDLRLLPFYERELRSEHEHTLKLRNNIAISLRCLGRFDEALAYDEETLQERQRTLGYADEYTLTSQFAVARDLRRLGRYEEALDLIRQVNDTLEHKGAPWNLFRLLVGAEVGLSLRRVGQYEDAWRQGEEIFKRHHALIGKTHRQSLLVATYLINDRRFTGDLDGAAELGENTIEAMVKTAGPDHPNTNAARANLAIVRRLQGDLVRARQLDERALTCFNDLYEENHPSTLIVMTNLASDLAAVGDVHRARELGEAAWTASRQVRGENHPCTLITAANLSLDRRATGDETGARELREATLPALEVAYGKLHPQTRLAANKGRVNMDIEPMAT